MYFVGSFPLGRHRLSGWEFRAVCQVATLWRIRICQVTIYWEKCVVSVEGARRSFHSRCTASLSLRSPGATQAILAPLHCELSADQTPLKSDASGLVNRDTELDLKHGLEHRPRYPLPVKVDATRNAGAYSLGEIFRIMTRSLQWCCERLESIGKKVLLLIWDNASCT
jgi:hypothetical protein